MRPLAYLALPARVDEVDLAGPIGPIGSEGYHTVRLLVRRDGRPLGWVTLEKPGPVIPADQVRQTILEQLDELARGAVDARIERAPRAADPAPPISVVVCTRDRADRLEHCLRSLLELDYPEFEVLVVDNAPSGSEARRLAASLGVRYVVEPNAGLDRARNRGVAEATHDLLAFTDDDVQVDRRWLRALAAGFVNPDVMLVTGLVAPAELETEAQVAFEFRYGGMGKGYRARSFTRDDLEWQTLIGAYQIGIGANMAFRRSALERVGGFDPVLDVGTPTGGGGDTDIFHRVLLAGAVVRYEPSAIVWHSHRRTWPELQRQLQANGRGTGAYLLHRWLDPPTIAPLPRTAIVKYGFVWLGWMVKRIVQRFRQRETLSLPLQLAELAGALSAPWALWRSRRQAALVAASTRRAS